VGPAIEQATPAYLNAMKNVPQATFADNAHAGLLGNAVLGMAQGVANIPHNILGGSTRLGEQIGNGLSGNTVDLGQVVQGANQSAQGLMGGATVQGALSGAQSAWNATPFSNAGANRAFQVAQQAEREAGTLSPEGFVKDAQGWRDPLSGHFAPNTVSQVQEQLPQYMLQAAPPSPGRALGGMDRVQLGASRLGN